MKQRNRRKCKIRLLHLVNGLGVGGAEILVYLYIKALSIEDYDHYVYYFGPDGPTRNKIESLGVPVYRGKRISSIKRPLRFTISLFSLLKDLFSFINFYKIQVIQSHLSYANYLAVAVGKLSGVPAFPTIHNTMETIDRRSRWDLRVYLRKIVEALIYRKADRLIAVSQEIKEIINQNIGINNEKILVVKNGIILDELNDMCFSKRAIISKQSILFQNKEFIIIAVGRLTYQKNFEVLIKAIDCVIDRGFEDLLVMIIGTGEEKLRLKKLIRELELTKYIKLLGIRHDVLELMKVSDLFVMPSRYEGLSIAMIEAMACGLPIIGSDCPGIRDYVKNNLNGLLFPIDDYTALAKHILQLAEDKDLKTILSKGAKNSFINDYDLYRNIKPLDEMFRKCANTKSIF